MNHKVKVGIAHPRLGRGGSEAAAMWGIEALKEGCKLSLITADEVDLDGLNRFYGTSVKEEDIVVRQALIPPILQKMNVAAALRGAFYHRFCRRNAGDFDVLISAYNLCDFGVPAIHCLADFSWDEEIRVSLDPTPAGLLSCFHQNSFLRKTYLSMVKVLSRPSGRNLFSGKDIILANSNWSANLIRKKYGIEVDTLYPPVADEFPLVPVEEREVGFVCIGRISPEKRIEQIINILKEIRNRGHDIHLHVIGGISGGPYGKKTIQLFRDNPFWVTAEGSCFGNRKQRLLTGHKFGIHGRRGEPFGIAVAEMVKAGCIVFAPSEGGQAEIVNHQSLLYDSVEDAIDKIDAVIRQPKLQYDLRDHLVKQGAKYSTSNYMHGLRTAVTNFLCEKEKRRKTS